MFTYFSVGPSPVTTTDWPLTAPLFCLSNLQWKLKEKWHGDSIRRSFCICSHSLANHTLLVHSQHILWCPVCLGCAANLAKVNSPVPSACALTLLLITIYKFTVNIFCGDQCALAAQRTCSRPLPQTYHCWEVWMWVVIWEGSGASDFSLAILHTEPSAYILLMYQVNCKTELCISNQEKYWRSSGLPV